MIQHILRAKRNKRLQGYKKFTKGVKKKICLYILYMFGGEAMKFVNLHTFGWKNELWLIESLLI
jgi:hypothetical protein